MRGSIRMLLLIAVSCIGMSCAHTTGPPSEMAQQDQGQAVASASQGTAEIQIPETTYDFGKVKDTEGMVVHEFKVKNVGTGPLQIKKVLPG